MFRAFGRRKSSRKRVSRRPVPAVPCPRISALGLRVKVTVMCFMDSRTPTLSPRLCQLAVITTIKFLRSGGIVPFLDGDGSAKRNRSS